MSPPPLIQPGYFFPMKKKKLLSKAKFAVSSFVNRDSHHFLWIKFKNVAKIAPPPPPQYNKVASYPNLGLKGLLTYLSWSSKWSTSM